MSKAFFAATQCTVAAIRKDQGDSITLVEVLPREVSLRNVQFPVVSVSPRGDLEFAGAHLDGLPVSIVRVESTTTVAGKPSETKEEKNVLLRTDDAALYALFVEKSGELLSDEINRRNREHTESLSEKHDQDLRMAREFGVLRAETAFSSKPLFLRLLLALIGKIGKVEL